jgi:hypothetical protein
VIDLLTVIDADRFALMSPLQRRAVILRLQGEIEKLTPEAGRITSDACPLKHHFAPGQYGREIFVAAGNVVIGKIHIHAHLNIVSQGRCLVFTEDGLHEIAAPLTFVSLPGTKRVVFVLEDLIWTTVHATTKTDLAEIEAEIIAPDYEALPAALEVEALEVTS